MIIDGKKIAEEIYEHIAHTIATLEKKPRLAIFTCAPNFETEKYLALKTKKAAAVGISIHLEAIPEDASTDEVVRIIEATLPVVDGAILQLPFPAHIDAEKALGAIPVMYDVDALNPKNSAVLSPVVAACKEILMRHDVSLKNKIVTVIGSGKLVGLPAAKWFMSQEASVSVVTKDTADISYYTRQADIIVSGAGDPGFLVPEMVKEGVIVLDAGTSEEGGMLRGDVDPSVALKASIFTPVPGGIGPMTVAMLFKNLLTLIEKRKE